MRYIQALLGSAIHLEASIPSLYDGIQTSSVQMEECVFCFSQKDQAGHSPLTLETKLAFSLNFPTTVTLEGNLLCLSDFFLSLVGPTIIASAL